MPEAETGFIRLTRRTVVFICVFIITTLFALLLSLWIVNQNYHDARDDLSDLKQVNECARQINAESVVAIGRLLVAQGHLLSAEAAATVAVATLGVDSPQAKEATAKLPALAKEVDDAASDVSDKWNRALQVNTICDGSTPQGAGE